MGSMHWRSPFVLTQEQMSGGYNARYRVSMMVDPSNR
jgi:hypothetical protein